MHGNEPVGGPVLERLRSEASGRLRAGRLLLVRANPEAERVDARHTPDGTDLNRLWDRPTLERLSGTDPEQLCYEERRVLELAPLIESCDAILDLHSTSRPTAPFLLFRDDQSHAHLARRLGVANLVTGLHENGIMPGGLCSNIGLEPGQQSPRLGFTYEAGQHDDPDNMVRAWKVAVQLLVHLGLWLAEVEPVGPVTPEVFEVVERFRQAPGGTTPYRFVGYEGGEAGGGRRGPTRKLHSFEEIQADEVVVRRGRDRVVRAPYPFTMLMPAPDTAPGTDLFYFAQRRNGGLSDGRVLDDRSARREAKAIERMLDLLADDDFIRGSTWASFDSRQLLDLCASIVSRTLRLPPGHPHRKLTIMGRGNGEGSERERRAGQRYRLMMRRAIEEGVDVHRVQLMRGAPLGWLDSLTSHGMLEVLRAREQAHLRSGLEDSPLRMTVSLRQPHTVSLLVAGNLDWARESGDFRHVRVGLLIEAASVEPDGETAKVRVVRMGLVSSRPEMLNVASNILGAIEDEHQHLVRHGVLSLDPRLQALLSEDGHILAVPDAEKLADIHNILYLSQLRAWCEALETELHVRERIRSPQALGRWLATTMASTGIFDADALRRLVIRSTAREWIADPALVAQFRERLDSSDDCLLDGTGALPALQAPRPRPLPAPPVLAADVTADALERWVGWKRSVRGAQAIPGARGKDIDLALSEGAIRGRISRWYDRARDLGAQHPGDVMVVVAGDGLNPSRDEASTAMTLLRAHRDLVRDPNVHYLRIQHALGTHLSWFKDLLATLEQRPHGHSVALQWEVEHGATVNVVLLGRRGHEEMSPRAWTLQGWTFEACAVILADLEGAGLRDYKMGLFTEGNAEGAGLSQELVHFGRAHCSGLLKQAGWRRRDAHGPPPTWEMERALVSQIARWIERVRGWREQEGEMAEVTAEWVARRLNIADDRLARALAYEMDQDGPVIEAAEALWSSVPAWPGPLWSSWAESPVR